MRLNIPFLICFSYLSSKSLGFNFQSEEKNIYVKHRLDKICTSNRSKTRLNVKQEVVSVFTFNSSLLLPRQSFKCHLELYLPSSSYGFSVFIEEMSLTGSSLSGCSNDYVQFGRDILFVTTHLSQKYCGDVELPVPRKKNGVVSFDFPFTPLARRIYNEEEDKEMDIWINIDTASQHLEDVGPKTLTLVVTPFKKSCATRDSLYQQCRFSTKCVRRELFCDGRINCAWPYVEPADEVHCLETLAPPDKSYFATDIFVIFLVLSLLVAMVAVLVLAVNKYSGKTKHSSSSLSSSEVFCNSELLDDQLDYRPSCPPPPDGPLAPPLAPPPPYSAHPLPPPSYSLLGTRST